MVAAFGADLTADVVMAMGAPLVAELVGRFGPQLTAGEQLQLCFLA